MTISRRTARLLFLALALGIYSAIFFVTRSERGLAHGPAVSLASLFDLTVTVSACFYFLLVRTGYASWLSLAAIAACGFRATGILLPASDAGYLPSLKWFSVGLEGFALGLLISRIRKVPRGSDKKSLFECIVAAAVPYPWLARAIAAEICLFYYALFSWRAKPLRDPRAFANGEASGYKLLGILLAVCITCESVPLHFLLAQHHATASWIVAGLDAYFLLWAIAMVRAADLRTIVLEEDRLKIRAGLIWETEILLSDVKYFQPWRAASLPVNKSYLKTVVLNDPQFLLKLSRPGVALGLLGRSRVFSTIGFSVDAPGEFASALDSAISKLPH